MMGKETEQTLKYLKENHGKYAVAVAEKSCFGLEENFFYDDVERGEQVVIFDPYAESDKPYPFDPKEIVPHLDRLEMILLYYRYFVQESCNLNY